MVKYLKHLQKPPFAVVLISFLILYLELALIRFIPAHVLYFSFFTNFVLIASFLGIGLGFLVSKQKINLINFFPYLLLTLIILTQIFSTGLNIDSSEVIFFRDPIFDKQPIAIPNFILLPILFTWIALVFCPLGQFLGRFFIQSTNTLAIYAQDIVGSILGIVIFSLISYFSLPPPFWFGLFSLIFLLMAVKSRFSLIVFIAVFAGISILTFDFGSEKFFWSPYYRITLIRDSVTGSGLILVNNINHQYFSTPEYALLYSLAFSQIKTFGPMDEILIIGSGTGQDVAAALAAGAKHITAVEIDPQILNIGQKFHPQKPYSDPKVTTIIDDGRSFLRNSKQKFDVIIYALTDSLVLNSGLSEIRLESFLFTLESFKDAKEHLKKDGTFVMYNDYRKEWLIDRLENMLKEVFGSSVKRFDLARTIKMFKAKSSEVNPSSPSQNLPSDDWPFLYLRERSIPTFYLSIILAVGLISAISIIVITKMVKRTFILSKRAAIFFLLGAAFALLETKSIVQLNLLFGVTWFVNTVAFSGILLAILAACLVTYKYRFGKGWILWILLFTSLAIQLLIPVSRLFYTDPVIRFIISVSFFYLPIFFANLIFTHFFSQSHSPELDFGSNLLGLVFGGIAEYTALITGYSNLALMAGCFYLLAGYFSFSKLDI